MAECKTMVRRKSRDSLFRSNNSGGTSSVGGTSCGCGHNSRSKSYHHHNFYNNSHQLHSNFYQGLGVTTLQNGTYHPSIPISQGTILNPCQTPYYGSSNGYGSSPPNQLNFGPPGHYSSVSSGAVDMLHQQMHAAQMLSNPPPPNLLQGMEPPPRPWIQLAHSKHKRTCFTLLCYNILCARYATKTQYNYCPVWALDWNYRRKLILQELVHYAPDIISLQELETDQFYNFFLPQLQLLGYSGVFGAKSRARTMMESKRKMVDGCAIFYRTNKFRLLSEHLIEFSQMAIAYATSGHCSEEMLNRVQTKDNIALAALFETKVDAEQVSGLRGLVAPRPRPLLVCTCHIHWDPEFCDVKLVQTMMLMQELRNITDKITLDSDTPVPNQGECVDEHRSGSSSSASSSTSCSVPANTLDKVLVLVCGDFNSLPQSGVVEFMQSGAIRSQHPDFKGLTYEGYLKTFVPHSVDNLTAGDNTPSPPPPAPSISEEETEFQHDFGLKSVYHPNTMPFTNYTLDFQGVIDYIFHSAKGLRPLGLLGPLDQSWLVQHNIVGAPHPCIPSDHLPLVVELEMIPAI